MALHTPKKFLQIIIIVLQINTDVGNVHNVTTDEHVTMQYNSVSDYIMDCLNFILIVIKIVTILIIISIQ